MHWPRGQKVKGQGHRLIKFTVGDDNLIRLDISLVSTALKGSTTHQLLLREWSCTVKNIRISTSILWRVFRTTWARGFVIPSMYRYERVRNRFRQNTENSPQNTSGYTNIFYSVQWLSDQWRVALRLRLRACRSLAVGRVSCSKNRWPFSHPTPPRLRCCHVFSAAAAAAATATAVTANEWSLNYLSLAAR